MNCPQGFVAPLTTSAVQAPASAVARIGASCRRAVKAVSKFVYVGDVAWTLRVRARPGRHADSQSPRYTYTNLGTALKSSNRRGDANYKFALLPPADPASKLVLCTQP
ncbi:hypothetical protein GCM10011495_25590 [Hymenobacter frigidus]|uniref:Uncharacterized protein n=1 Tax=Hymenobacter frigidus TaxID=1524095 RepID=A0ABQ2A6U0_9BACT|nr:hypothetical protein GCM10011495_25590 [Hymenobacter frigidus]